MIYGDIPYIRTESVYFPSVKLVVRVLAGLGFAIGHLGLTCSSHDPFRFLGCKLSLQAFLFGLWHDFSSF